MESCIREALGQYAFTDPQTEFIRHNENITYKITDGTKRYELRIHKPAEGFSLGIYKAGDSRTAYLESEMLLVGYAGGRMMSPLQKPVKNREGHYVSVLPDGTPATVLEWVEGDVLQNSTVTPETGEAIGSMIAELHRCFRELDFDANGFSRTLNRRVQRYIYKQPLLAAAGGQMEIAAQKGQITKEQAAAAVESLHVIKSRMDELDSLPRMTGIVHADLSPSNLIVSNGRIVPIDFSLSGFGYSYMDVGMALCNFKDMNIRNSIRRGYEKVAGVPVPMRYIEPFFALGVLLYIACQHDRAGTEDWFGGAMMRWCDTIFHPLNEGRTITA